MNVKNLLETTVLFDTNTGRRYIATQEGIRNLKTNGYAGSVILKEGSPILSRLVAEFPQPAGVWEDRSHPLRDGGVVYFKVYRVTR